MIFQRKSCCADVADAFIDREIHLSKRVIPNRQVEQVILFELQFSHPENLYNNTYFENCRA